MVEPTLDWTFPFGPPLERRRPSAKSKRRVFVLGTIPGALHIAWWSPARKGIRALAVDNEPVNMWNGADERAHIEAWKKLVGFRLGEWGEVETSDEVNGKAGRWLDESVLGPLGIAREEACLSYCVDTYFVDNAVGFAVNERYNSIAPETGLPLANLPRRPRDGGLVRLAREGHADRLLKELSVVVPELVITLGGVPYRVLRAITQARDGQTRLRADDAYGARLPLTLGKRQAAWLPLTSHEGAPSFVEAHARWRQSLAQAGRGVDPDL